MNRSVLLQGCMERMEALMRASALRHGQLPASLPPRAQLGVLLAVSHHGAVTVKDIAQRFSMTSSAATQLINGLVNSRLLMRTTDMKDRRKSVLALTTQGKKMLTKARAYRLKRMTEMLKALTDKDLKQFIRLQEKIVSHAQTTWKKK
jgi:DNA-binding MarR family transcriptional regulator